MFLLHKNKEMHIQGAKVTLSIAVKYKLIEVVLVYLRNRHLSTKE